MTHMVEQMAYVGRKPWHGLGNELDSGESLEVWSRQAGLDWRIEESPVRFTTNDERPTESSGLYEQAKVLYRSDTKAPLSVVGNRFRVVQPGQILEFYRDLTDVSGFELETAGTLKGGRKVWALARTGHQGVLPGKDEIDGYVLLATACDGSMATTAQFTSVRVVCNNTLAVALDNASGMAVVKVRHSTDFDADAVKRRLGIAVSHWDEFLYRLKSLSERKVSRDEARSFFESVFVRGEPAEDRPNVNERSVAQALSLYEGRGLGARLPSCEGTAYGLVNAVTQFVDHERRARSVDHRLDSAWFGEGANLKNRSMEQAVDLIA